MAKMYTSSKTNPITGEPSSVKRLSQSSGYDRKREPLELTGGKGSTPSKSARTEKKENKAYMKSLDEGIKSNARSIKKGERASVRESKNIEKSQEKPKDWRDKSKPDTGGKKGTVVKGGKGGRVNYNKMDTSCKKPK